MKRTTKTEHAGHGILTPRRLVALRRLHAGRRGVRVNDEGVSRRERETVLAKVLAAVREPVRGVSSRRVVAAWCRVDPHTVCRWLSGEDWPPASQIERLKQWLRRRAS